MDIEQIFKEGSAAYDADDFVVAMAKLLPLSDAGHPGAQYIVAEMYRWGNGVEQNAELCMRCYKSAADRGHPQAAYYLSMLLAPAARSAPLPMETCPKNEVESDRYLALAVLRFKELAEAGEMEAMSFLGFLFHIGMGVALDGAESIRWYTRAFNAGGHGAANGLCLVYYEGDIRVRDRTKALYWYMTAKSLKCQFVGIGEFESNIQPGVSEKSQLMGSVVWGYEIHIRRDGRRISLEEWQIAAESIEGVRLRASSTSITNPTTGEVIDIPSLEGSAEILIAEGKWLPLLRWRSHHGDIAFPLQREFCDETGAVRTAVRQIASRLNAQIVGDGGERYA